MLSACGATTGAVALIVAMVLLDMLSGKPMRAEAVAVPKQRVALRDGVRAGAMRRTALPTSMRTCVRFSCAHVADGGPRSRATRRMSQPATSCN